MQTHAGNRSWQPFCGRNGAEAMLRTRRGRGRGGTGGRPRARSSAVGDKGRDGGAHRRGRGHHSAASRGAMGWPSPRPPLAAAAWAPHSARPPRSRGGWTWSRAPRPPEQRRAQHARPPRQRTPPRAAAKPGCREPTARGEQKQRRLGGSE